LCRSIAVHLRLGSVRKDHQAVLRGETSQALRYVRVWAPRGNGREDLLGVGLTVGRSSLGACAAECGVDHHVVRAPVAHHLVDPVHLEGVQERLHVLSGDVVGQQLLGQGRHSERGQCAVHVEGDVRGASDSHWTLLPCRVIGREETHVGPLRPHRVSPIVDDRCLIVNSPTVAVLLTCRGWWFVAQMACFQHLHIEGAYASRCSTVDKCRQLLTIWGGVRVVATGASMCTSHLGWRRRAAKMKIAQIAGDGIGSEVMTSARLVLDELPGARDLQWTELDWCCARYADDRVLMPEDGLATLAEHDAILLGAVGAPGVPDHVSLWGLLIPIRRVFDQYVNLRPVRAFDGVQVPLREDLATGLDLVVVRENTEGEYSRIGGRHGTGDSELAEQTAIFTRSGIARVAHDAARRAAERSGRLTVATKSNGIVH